MKSTLVTKSGMILTTYIAEKPYRVFFNGMAAFKTLTTYDNSPLGRVIYKKGKTIKKIDTI